MKDAFVSPEHILATAERLYPKAVQAWLEGNSAFFPVKLRVNLNVPKEATLSGVIAWSEALESKSKQRRGYGYTLVRQRSKKRRFGDNHYPSEVLFETMDDLVRFLGKTAEFRELGACVALVCKRLPHLESWLHIYWKKLLDVQADLPDLITVVEYMRANPQPGCYIRELPVPVSTKLVAKHKSLLRQWLDASLDSSAIYSGTEQQDFEDRYGFRSVQNHVLIRLLDPNLKSELGFPCDELSMPADSIGKLPVRDAVVFVLENKVSLINALCLPAVPRGIAVGGLGNNLKDLQRIEWLAEQRLVYWGDIDVEGLEILGRFRWQHNSAVSLLMDGATLREFRGLCIKGNGKPPNSSVEYLSPMEREALEMCERENIRLEQERIPFPAVVRAVEQKLSSLL